MTPNQFIATLDEPRRSDMKQVFEAIKKAIPKQKPYVDGNGIGFGKYHYVYESGREGDAPVVGLANNKREIAVHICAAVDGKYVAESYKAKFPKANVGKGCIRFRRASDIDLKVLAEAVKKGAAHPLGA